MKWKEKLQHLLVAAKSKRLPMQTFEFPASLQGSRRMLITLPFGIQTNSTLLRMISELTVIFPSSDMAIVVPANCSEIARKTGIHAFSPDLYAANLIGLPRKTFFRKVTEYDASVFIDFETRRNIFNALVAIYSRAGLRIGLAGVWGAPLHNFEIRSGYQHDELKVYRSMIDLLTSFQLHSMLPRIGELP